MKQSNPFKDRDLTKRLKFPKISWSSFDSFVNCTKYQKTREDWYRSYVLGIKQPPTDAMICGTLIGEKIATDPLFLPEVPRGKEFEVELEAKFCNINLIGHIDSLSLKHGNKKLLLEYKTSASATRWTGLSVKRHFQIDFYLLLLWLTYKVKPEDFIIKLVYIPVERNMDFTVTRSAEPVQIIPTTRTLAQVLRFGAEIKKTYSDMCKFVQEHE